MKPSFDTPTLLVDLDVFDANLARMVERLAGRVALRPHLKTAKSPAVARRLLVDQREVVGEARRLLQAGAVGICVAKLGEAAVMLAAGIPDVLVTTEVAGGTKAAHLARLVREHPGRRIATVVDSLAAARIVDAALDRPLDALVDVNVGQDRCGVAPEDALALADGLVDLEHLRVIGLQGYEGHLQHVRDPGERRARNAEAMERLGETAATLRAGGHTVDVVSTGGTGTAELCAEHPAVTEVQPGSFVFMDADYLATEGVGYASSLVVHATVVSRPAAHRIVVDAGLKALSDDSGPARPAGLHGWTYHHAGDEHGILSPGDGAEELALQPGDTVDLIPSHIDTTINLYDVLHALRGGSLVEDWPISARGKSQ